MVRATLAIFSLATLLASTSPGAAEVAPEAPGRIERLQLPLSPHTVWVTDLMLQRIALMDLDSGRFLGMINSGYGPALALFPKHQREIYLPATYFARGFRGKRTDVLEVWDTTELDFKAEVVLPARRAIDNMALGHAALSDDDRIAAVFNWTPATTLSLVDVGRRSLIQEVPIAGCSLVYTAGPRRFFSLCGDGSALIVELDAEGKLLTTRRSDPFFDPNRDPIMEKGVRLGEQWLFPSFDGQLYVVDVGGNEVLFHEPWSLLDTDDRADSWRVGGSQPLAAHPGDRTLYVLVHRGGPDTHKEPGEEVWVYDVTTRKRTQRIPLLHPGLTVIGVPLEPRDELPWPIGEAVGWMLDATLPAQVSHIVVTRDAQPLLVTASQFVGSLGLYDARSGEFLRRVAGSGVSSETLYAPYEAP